MLTVIGASLLSTAIHYTDNYIYVHEYPQPDWISHEVIYTVWALLTLLGLAGYLFYRDGRATAAGLYLLVYSYAGLSSLGHYFYGSLGDFSVKMHVLIWADGVTGLAVAIAAVRLLVRGRGAAGEAIASS